MKIFRKLNTNKAFLTEESAGLNPEILELDVDETDSTQNLRIENMVLRKQLERISCGGDLLSVQYKKRIAQLEEELKTK